MDNNNIRLKKSALGASGQSVCSSDGKYRTHRVTITDSVYRYSKEESSIHSSDRLSSQWEELMRKFSQDVKQKEPLCKKFYPDDTKCKPRPLREFPTGSKYEGTWNMLGMSGYGTYTFPNGVVYEGEFEDKTFHGAGELRYPSGIVLRGKWNYGNLVDRTVIFSDGVVYDEKHWTYCKAPDRRFSLEIFGGLKPGCIEAETAELPTKEIPPGFYDTGDGFFNPITKFVYKYNDLTSVVRGTDEAMQEWIVNNCRTNPYLERGPKPELYEEMTDAKIEPDVVPSATCILESNLGSDLRKSYANPSTSEVRRKQRSDSRNWSKNSAFKYDPSRTNFETFRLEKSLQHLNTSGLKLTTNHE